MVHYRLTKFLLPLLTLCLIIGSLAGTAVAEEKAQTSEKSLYDRLGGVYAIATVVDVFIDKLYVNDILNANPMIKEAHERVSGAALKYQVTSLVCQLTGGPEKYNGRNMVDAHKHLNISNEEWDAMVTDFVTILNEFKVPEKEQQELLALLGPSKADVVTAE